MGIFLHYYEGFWTYAYGGEPPFAAAMNIIINYNRSLKLASISCMISSYHFCKMADLVLLNLKWG